MRSKKQSPAATGRKVEVQNHQYHNPLKAARQDIFVLARQVSILRVVQDLGGVKLRPQGRHFVELCPFHQEKTPSFTVTPGKQLFFCFGCGAGGDGITFLARLWKLTPLDAAREICRAFDLAADRPLSPAARRRIREEIAAWWRERRLEAAFDAWRNATIRGLGVLERACQQVIQGGPQNPGFEVACELEPRTGYLLDTLLYGPRKAQIELFRREGWSWVL